MHIVRKKVSVFSIKVLNNAIVFFYKKKKLNLFKTHTIIFQNTFLGMAEKYLISLKLEGVGYSVIKKNKKLVFNLGFSHKLNYLIPTFVDINISKKNIQLTNCSFQKIKNFSAILRYYKFPEPYKGKGIRYLSEFIVLKESKKSK